MRTSRYGTRLLHDHILALLETWDGRILDYTAIARTVGLSRTAVTSHIKLLAEEGRLRLLPRRGGKGKAILVVRSCAGSPRSALTEALRKADPRCALSWWKTGTTRVVDVIAEMPGGPVGICLADSLLLRHKNWLPLEAARRRGVIARGFLLHPGTRAFVASRDIVAIPFLDFVREARAWLLRRHRIEDVRFALDLINMRAVSAFHHRRPGRRPRKGQQAPGSQRAQHGDIFTTFEID